MTESAVVGALVGGGISILTTIANLTYNYFQGRNQRQFALRQQVYLDACAWAANGSEYLASIARLDLDDAHVRRAIGLGVKIAINSDAHHPDGLENLVYGVATARRGWATAAEILNTMTLDELLAWKGARRARQA